MLIEEMILLTSSVFSSSALCRHVKAYMFVLTEHRKVTSLTNRCPVKHMKMIKERMRKAIPNDIPKTAVLKKKNTEISSVMT